MENTIKTLNKAIFTIIPNSLTSVFVSVIWDDYFTEFKDIKDMFKEMDIEHVAGGFIVNNTKECYNELLEEMKKTFDVEKHKSSISNRSQKKFLREFCLANYK